MGRRSDIKSMIRPREEYRRHTHIRTLRFDPIGTWLAFPLSEVRLSLSDNVSECFGGGIMASLIALSSVWGVITLTFIILLLYRRSLTKQESDWIPLTDDAKEDSAIQAQKIIEAKTHKLTVPIRALGTLSLVMLLVIVGFWVVHSLFTPPPITQ
jgi:hypothetical protein